MKILVFGGSGRTGQIICRQAAEAGHDVIAPTHAGLDLADTQAVTRMVLGSGAQAVVNAAAISGLEACLDHPLQAHLVNAAAPAAMALACRHTGARFIHLSTDYVLDGRRPGPKGEDSRCRPINLYGESKRAGEEQVLDAWGRSLILRVSWIVGNPAKPSFVEQTLARAIRGEALAAIADKWSLPTDAHDIARVVLELIPRPVYGILHVCSGGKPQSWHSCAVTALQAAVDMGALPSLPQVVEQHLDEVPFFRTPRPRHTAMDNRRLTALGIPMPSAGECLRSAAQRLFRPTLQP